MNARGYRFMLVVVCLPPILPCSGAWGGGLYDRLFGSPEKRLYDQFLGGKIVRELIRTRPFETPVLSRCDENPPTRDTAETYIAYGPGGELDKRAILRLDPQGTPHEAYVRLDLDSFTHLSFGRSTDTELAVDYKVLRFDRAHYEESVRIRHRPDFDSLFSSTCAGGTSMSSYKTVHGSFLMRLRVVSIGKNKPLRYFLQNEKRDQGMEINETDSRRYLEAAFLDGQRVHPREARQLELFENLHRE